MTSESGPTRVLLVERSPADAAQFCRALSGAVIGTFVVETADHAAAAVTRLASTRIDIIVVDLALPNLAGIETLEALHSAAPTVPIVVLTKNDDDRAGLDALTRGADDYVVRGDFDGRVIARSLLYAIERRRFQEQLGRRDDQLAEVQHIAGLGSFEWDIPADRVTWSDELYRIYGVQKALFNPTYQGFLDLVPRGDRERVEQLIRTALETRRPYDFEHRAIHAAGHVIVLHARGHIIVDDAGQPIRIAGTGQDVTERKKLEEKLHFADRMSSVGTLAAGVAHEINNPLTFLLANLEFIEKEVASGTYTSPSRQLGELGEMVHDALQGAERIRRIVRGLKTFSRADDEDRIPLELQPVLETAVSMTSNEIRHRARLVTDYGNTPVIEADETRLSQVFVNLLINAVQSLRDGPIEENEIRIHTSTDANGSAVVEVHDTGSGIPEANRDRIFDPFFTTKPIGEGTGLGLAICHGIVTAHGGEIAMESVVGKGTTFRITLPAAHARTPRDTVAPPTVATSGRRGRVLIIDDEPMVIMALRRLLSGDHDVIVANDGREAMALFEQGARFDAILSDLMMPVMSGFDLFDQLSATVPEQTARFIFITGGAFTAAAQAFLDRVPNPRIEKPFDMSQVKLVIRNLVG